MNWCVLTVCMYVCMYVCFDCMCVCACVMCRRRFSSKPIPIEAYALRRVKTIHWSVLPVCYRTHVYMYVCMDLRFSGKQIPMQAYVLRKGDDHALVSLACVHVCLVLHTHLHTYIHTHPYIHIHIHIYIYIYIYIYTCRTPGKVYRHLAARC
jgi:hypothetical protein